MLATLVSCLDTLGPGVTRLPGNVAKVRVRLADPAFASGDPLVVALTLACKGRDGLVRLDMLCNVLGLPPQDVLSGVFTLQVWGLDFCRETGTGV